MKTIMEQHETTTEMSSQELEQRMLKRDMAAMRMLQNRADYEKTLYIPETWHALYTNLLELKEDAKESYQAGHVSDACELMLMMSAGCVVGLVYLSPAPPAEWAVSEIDFQAQSNVALDKISEEIRPVYHDKIAGLKLVCSAMHLLEQAMISQQRAKKHMIYDDAIANAIIDVAAEAISYVRDNSAEVDKRAQKRFV